MSLQFGMLISLDSKRSIQEMLIDFSCSLQSKIEELTVNLQHLQDQNMLLKAQRNNNVIIDETGKNPGVT